MGWVKHPHPFLREIKPGKVYQRREHRVLEDRWELSQEVKEEIAKRGSGRCYREQYTVVDVCHCQRALEVCRLEGASRGWMKLGANKGTL